MKVRMGGSLSILIWPLLSQALALLIMMSTKPSPAIELQASESLGLSIFYVSAVFLMAALMVYLVRRGKELVIRTLIFILLVYSAFLSLDTLFSYFLEVQWYIEIALALLIAWLSFREDALGNLAKSLLAASMAYLFVSFFNDLFLYFLLALLSIYDAYSVFRGPLSELFSVSGRDSLRALTVFQGEVGMGLGDVFCYSMASATSFRSLEHPLYLLPIALLNSGIVLTIYILRIRGRALPGLTIPILMWLIPQVALNI